MFGQVDPKSLLGIPENISKIIEKFFPSGDVVGPAAPGTNIIGGASKGLIGALAPLMRGSLKRGAEVAPEVSQTLGKGLQEAPPSLPAAAFIKHMNSQTLEPPTIERLLAGSKTTGKVPHRSIIQPDPKTGLEIPRQSYPAKRPASVEHKFLVQRGVDAHIEAAKSQQLAAHTRKQLSGPGTATIPTDPDVIEQIQRAGMLQHLSPRQISKMFNLSEYVISQIMRKPITWAGK
jgi:hypothetical protein